MLSNGNDQSLTISVILHVKPVSTENQRHVRFEFIVHFYGHNNLSKGN